MSTISNILAVGVDWIWSTPLVILLVGGGCYLLVLSRGIAIRYFFRAIRLLGQRQGGTAEAQGVLSPFQGLTNALSATVGLGNIAGVAVAINYGGPGAIFWMWVSALVGMHTKFFEVAIALIYRGDNHVERPHGGAMYILGDLLSGPWKVFAWIFAAAGFIGTMSIFNANQLSLYFHQHYSVPPLVTGVLLGTSVLYILFGGVRRLASVTQTIVPLMGLLYVLLCLYVLVVRADIVPGLFAQIFYEAFHGRAALGGALGLGVMQVMQTGIQRAAFSNEAGLGTAPLAHSDVRSNDPIASGLVASIGPFIDTILICTMTALVVLVYQAEGGGEAPGLLLSAAAFNAVLPSVGEHLFGVCVFFFAYSTVVGCANYSGKCWGYLTKSPSLLGGRKFAFIYSIAMFLGALFSQVDALNIIDACFGIMAWISMPLTLYFSGQVIRRVKSQATS